MRRKRSPVEVGASLSVSKEQDTSCFTRSQGPSTQPLPHLSRAWEALRALLLSLGPRQQRRESEEMEIKRTGILHPILLWPHVLSCSPILHHISKTWYHEEGKRDLSQCLAFSCLWLQGAQDRKTHSPKQEHGKETWQYPSPSPRYEAPSLPPPGRLT